MSKNSDLTFTMADLCVLTGISACTAFLFVHASNCNYSATEFARTLDYDAAAVAMVAFTLGLVVFPCVFASIAFLILRRTNLRLKVPFATYFFLLAFLSVPVSFAIARSCAGAIGG